MSVPLTPDAGHDEYPHSVRMLAPMFAARRHELATDDRNVLFHMSSNASMYAVRILAESSFAYELPSVSGSSLPEAVLNKVSAARVRRAGCVSCVDCVARKMAADPGPGFDGGRRRSLTSAVGGRGLAATSSAAKARPRLYLERAGADMAVI